MKRTERHHLKKNEFEVLTLQAMDMFSAKRREVTTIVLVLAVIGLGAAGYWAWHPRTEDKAYARSGQFEQAITAYKELAQRKDGQLPIDGILIQLGRTYRDAGKAGDAQQTFNKLVEEFPDSPFTADAKREIDALKKTSKA